MQKKLHIKVGDTVKVLSGEYRGKQGKVLVIDRNKERAIVEGLNIVKKHVKPSASNPQGGIVEKEAGLHISNLAVVDKNGKATKSGTKVEGDKKVRVAKTTGETL